MPSSLAGLLVLIQMLAALGEEMHWNHGHVSSARWLPRELAGPAVAAETLVAEESLPTHFDWRNVNGKNFVTADWNQHIPQYCGACWIHGTVSALNDRIKVMRQAKFPDVMLGRQAVVNCVPSADGKGPNPGCNGGDAWLIHRYMHENKIPDETCMPYQARNMACEPFNVCRNCGTGEKGCWPVKNWIGYGVSSYGKVVGEKAMMKEIYARGPIVCSFATDDDYMYRFSENVIQHEGVYATPKRYNESQIDHDMEVAGWGETPSGMKYWVIRNSWGTYWGESGWLKLRRGVNELLSESDCAWAVPTFDDIDVDLEGKVLGDYMLGIQTLPEVAAKVDGPVALAQAGLEASDGKNVGSTAALPCAFIAGIAVTLAVVKLAGSKRMQKQPFILG
jgi:hypothetical protein